jgi:hypothetical protein
VNPPDNIPTCVTQADDAISEADEGLENAQVVSVGRKPLPLTEISEPTGLVPELSMITGAESTFRRRNEPVLAAKMQMSVNARTSFK